MTHGSGGRAMAQLIEELFARHLGNDFLAQGNDGAVLPIPAGSAGDVHRFACRLAALLPRRRHRLPVRQWHDQRRRGDGRDAACIWPPASSSKRAFRSPNWRDRRVDGGAPPAPPACRWSPATPRWSKGQGRRRLHHDHRRRCRGRRRGFLGRPCPTRRPIIVSGSIGEHGMAIMAQRENLGFAAPIVSDTAALHGLIAAMRASGAAIRVAARPDARRRGDDAQRDRPPVGGRHDAPGKALPVQAEVAAACEFLGLDPLYVANEGKLLAIVAPKTRMRCWRRCGPSSRPARGDDRQRACRIRSISCR
jgi:hydrogenase expression/formation protein HypE